MQSIPSYDWGDVESPWIGAGLEIWGPLLDGRSPVRYPAQENIYLQGEEFTDLYIVAEGRVCVSIFHPDGQQRHLYIACPGAMFGEEACILGQPHSTMATAIVDTLVYCIPSREAQQLVHHNGPLADLMLQYQARKSRLMMAQSAMLSFDRAEQRIAKSLLHLCLTYGEPAAEGTRIQLRFTCTELAALVGTSRVTVNNVMLGLIHAGTLSREGACYVVRDAPALQALAVQLLDR